MTISTNYATPVTVNGYQCSNCTQVDEAKKHIDPAHPKSGPFGIDAKSDPSVVDNPSLIANAAATPGSAQSNSAGAGAGSNPGSGGGTGQPSSSTPGIGGLVDFKV